MLNTPIFRSCEKVFANTSNKKGGLRPPLHFAVSSLAATYVRRCVLDCPEDGELDDAVLRDRAAGRTGEEVIDIVSIRVTDIKASSRQINKVAVDNASRSEIDKLVSIDEQVLYIEPVSTGIRYDRERPLRLSELLH